MKNKKKNRTLLLVFSILIVLAVVVIIIFYLIIWHNRESNSIKEKDKVQSILNPEEPFLILGNDFTNQNILDSDAARSAIAESADIIGIQDVDNELSEVSKETALGNTYYRFKQEYEGIPVYGRNLIVASDENGNALSLTGNFLQLDQVRTDPTVNEEEAISTVKDLFSNEAEITNEGMTIYSLNSHSPELAWQFYVMDEGVAEYCFVSAKDATIIDELLLTFTDRVSCTGLDIDNKQQQFYAEYDNGEYQLEDTERGITVYNANNGTLKHELVIVDSNDKVYHVEDDNFVDEDNNTVYIDGDNYSYIIKNEDGDVIGTDGETALHLWTDNIFTDIEPVISDSSEWNNTKAVTLMSRLSTVYDFWETELHRNSYDGANGSISAVYDDYKRVELWVGDTTNAESYTYTNFPFTVLSFGTDNWLSLDTIAHEFTHSVEHSISNMSYVGESGALMEAYSDIFGEIVEDWSNDGELNNNCDWIHHNIRNMKSPSESSSPLPDTYNGDNWKDTSDTSKWNDNGGVHTNNTVISHAAYLMNTGISGNPAFESLDTKDIANLFYATLFTLPSDCNFEQFRTLIQNTANILCEQGVLSEKQKMCVSNAFFQVGVESGSLLAASEITLNVYDINDEIYDNYTLQVLYNDTETSYEGTNVNSDGISFPELGSYQLRIIDNSNEENVTELAVQVIGDKGVKQIPVYTQCGVTDINEFISETMPDSPEVLYSEVLDMFYNNIQSGWADYNEMPSLYGDKFSYLFPMMYSDPSYISSIGYSFIDLNDDGIKELLIGLDSEDETSYGDMYQNMIYDLYTYMNGKIIHLATSGERFAFQLCEDNSIYYWGSSGAASSAFYLYQLNASEPSFTILESVHSDPDENWENVYWYHSTTGWYDPESYSNKDEEFTTITEEEALSIRDSWPQIIDFPLTYFSEYSPHKENNSEATNNNQDNIDLTNSLESITNMIELVGGSPSQETGDHQSWYIGDNIQYGNYFESDRTDEIFVSGDKYQLFGVYYGQSLESAQKSMSNLGWKEESSNVEDYYEYTKDSMNFWIRTTGDSVSSFGFWRNTYY